ncbi:SprT family zinc-dependent metalloprotease [Thiohalocapsa marina]|uniref:SprT family zinc-dependent metalloprotease n=1 Tax=Thiohalocapsa marina TaxID=424902 RepID=A0A5M8FHN2_9GAMM|nr:SprT-like domain-containing protein [Thiohalocapsa marina]KAA6184398.1 SprT family zinc-dependent metalloprotease [Thiohalocapsa marina]
MNLDRAEALARRELRRFSQLADWSFGWNRRLRAHGLCRFDLRRIELSAPLTRREPDEGLILDTIRHELAHALAGRRAGHGPRWRAWAERVGCNHIGSSRASSPNAEDVPARYVLLARIDGRDQVVRHYHRRPSRAFLESLPQRFLRGRPETRGTLRLVCADNAPPDSR